MVIYLAPNYNICAVYTRKSLFSLLQLAEIYRFDKSWKGVCPVYLVAVSSGLLFAAEGRSEDGVTWLDLTFSAAITNPS